MQPGAPFHGLQQRDLAGTPADIARQLQHLHGLAFFDTAGNVRPGESTSLSLIAARPTQTISGDSYQLATLRDHATSHLACGFVSYNGDFSFGLYPEFLLYDHASMQWWERGHLSASLQTTKNASSDIGNMVSNLAPETYIQMVRRAKDYIAAGDIYQVNLSQKFTGTVTGPSLFPLYEALRSASPAPMASYLSLAGKEILSSSPELFLKMDGRAIETRPIKGTRPRFRDVIEDAMSAKALSTSAKEIAELVMITDLERNDLGQVCEFGSIHVPDMLKLEALEQVHHLVSTVRGTLRPDIDHISALTACLPGGSITGAPKKRATEIIAELEPSPRGIYTGAIGYLNLNGTSQFNLAIRTLIRQEESLSFHVGAGIVADSDPQAEYEETLHKAAGIKLALALARATAP